MKVRKNYGITKTQNLAVNNRRLLHYSKLIVNSSLNFISFSVFAVIVYCHFTVKNRRQKLKLGRNKREPLRGNNPQTRIENSWETHQANARAQNRIRISVLYVHNNQYIANQILQNKKNHSLS